VRERRTDNSGEADFVRIRRIWSAFRSIDSATVVTYRVNKTTGKLMPIGPIVKVGGPVTIVFAGA
jgi:hypothetical protein